MSRQLSAYRPWLLVALAALVGCHPQQPLYLAERGDLAYYLDRATELEEPDYESLVLDEVTHASAPLTLSNPGFKEFWDLSLEECIAIALHNSKVMRDLGTVRTTAEGYGDRIQASPETTPTVYDAAIQESAVGTPRTGGPDRGNPNNAANVIAPPLVKANQVGGVEDALSEFDAQFFSSLYYNKTDRPRNTIPGNPFQPQVFQSDVARFDATLRKKTATGGAFIVRNRTEYDRNNNPLDNPATPFVTEGFQALSSIWTTSLEVEVQHPLMQGYGVQVNRIPVVLARINTDITLAEFEASVRNLVADVEAAYWDLYLTYRILDAATEGRDSALYTWQLVRERAGEGIPAEVEARSREQYYFFRAQVESALTGSNVRDTGETGLYNQEARLRYLMGLASTDCRLIRPIDEPSTAWIEFPWCEILPESLFRSPELREQKWKIKQRELELIAARNKLLPELNVSGVYRAVGLGDQLDGDNGPAFPGQGSSAIDEMFSSNYQEAGLGVEFIPHRVGSRRELAGVRNAQLLLAREKALLEDMELNVSHLLANSIRILDTHFAQAQTHLNRHVAAHDEVTSQEAILAEGGGASSPDAYAAFLDRLLAAQVRRTRAKRAYWEAVTNYNKGIMLVHYRKGSLLELNNICLAEGPWPQGAYWDAMARARKRDASTPLTYGWSRPKVVSRGPVGSPVPVDGAAFPFDYEGLAVPPSGEAPPESIAPPETAPEEPYYPTPPTRELPGPTASRNADQRSVLLPPDTREAKRPEPNDSAGSTFDWGPVAEAIGSDGVSRATFQGADETGSGVAKPIDKASSIRFAAEPETGWSGGMERGAP
jgi:outer membrane protein TolC